MIALGFGPGRIGTLVSMATNSSHRVIMGKMLGLLIYKGLIIYLSVTYQIHLNIQIYIRNKHI